MDVVVVQVIIEANKLKEKMSKKILKEKKTPGGFTVVVEMAVGVVVVMEAEKAYLRPKRHLIVVVWARVVL